jgi:tetratricopeptide (TPR) repeat protein
LTTKYPVYNFISDIFTSNPWFVKIVFYFSILGKELPVRVYILLLFLLALLTGCSKDEQVKKKAPLFNNLGNLQFEITTTTDLARKYFNQGVALAYGFNHAEAYRSFKEVSRLDTNCAMAYWGMAIVLGPNINAPMDGADVPTAYEAIQKAITLLDNETQREKDYVLALSKRYVPEPPEDRTQIDSAYADAMRELSRRYPDDLNAATMFAEAVMDLHPWDYWLKDGTPQPWTGEILSTLERVLEKDPEHMGANHLYIHSVEASKNPGKGIPSAERLAYVAPGAGHLVHMPAHIYIRTGNYHQGSLANKMAIKSDEEYLSQCFQQGLYPLAYYPHNYHFLWATATLEGDSKTAIDAAVGTSEKPPDSLLNVCGYQTLQHYSVIHLYAYVTFGKWDEILNESEPLKEQLYPRGIWHYARGMAFTAKNQLTDAENELAGLDKLRDNKQVNELIIWGINSSGILLKIAYEVLSGEIAAKKKNYKLAISHLKKGIELESNLRYDEPPTWFYPVRQNLGAVLIEAGEFTEAEKIYLEDLEEIPENGWALYGLYQALSFQNKFKEAEEVKKRFNEAWKHADIVLKSSRIM